MRKYSIPFLSRYIGRSKNFSSQSSFDRGGISVFFAKLFFLSYIILLYFAGHFVDWKELAIEPYFILKGLKLYSDIATHHTPLLTEFLAVVYRFVGTGILIRKLLLVLVSAATAFLTYRAARRLAGKRAGLYSLLLFTIFWPFYGGAHFWFDAFLPVFFLIAFVLLIDGHSAKRLALAGISIGIAFLIKQSGAYIAPVIFLMLLVRSKPFKSRIKDCVVFSCGVLVPIFIISLWYVSREQLGEAYFWIVKYNLAGHYTKLAIKPPLVNDIIRLLVIIAPILLIFTGAIFSKAKRKKVTWEFRLALYMGFCASFAIFPRWERFHVASSIPFLVICLVLSFRMLQIPTSSLSKVRIHRITKAVLIIWIFYIFLDIGLFYPPMLVDRIFPHFASRWPLHSYDAPAFYDASYRRYVRDMSPIGRYVHDVTTKEDKIFVWGWEGSKIYFESDRLPAGRFYYLLPWFTCLPRFRKDLLMGFKKERPRYVIVTKKRRYPGNPTLRELGIELDKMGYIRLQNLEQRFPEVVIWEFTDFLKNGLMEKKSFGMPFPSRLNNGF